MSTKNISIAVEISDDAYKQNTVYRPWSDIQAGIRIATKPYTSAAQRPGHKNLLGAMPQ